MSRNANVARTAFAGDTSEANPWEKLGPPSHTGRLIIEATKLMHSTFHSGVIFNPRMCELARVTALGYGNYWLARTTDFEELRNL